MRKKLFIFIYIFSFLHAVPTCAMPIIKAVPVNYTQKQYEPTIKPVLITSQNDQTQIRPSSPSSGSGQAPTILKDERPLLTERAAHIIKVQKHYTPLVVVIMVKNEAEVIVPTLQPFVDGGVDSFLVYDTGSTDNTPAIVREFFAERSLEHAFVIEEKFVDFATSRNRALDLAEKIFSNADFMIMPDAEWYIHNAAELIDFCKRHKDYVPPGAQGGCYLIRILNQAVDFYQPRLVRCASNVRFCGRVHEVLNQQPSDKVPANVYFDLRPSKKGQEKSQDRWQRDLGMLLKDYEEDPTNPRTVFYLGQTCQFLDDWEQAVYYYKERLELIGWDEERYMAAYRLGVAIAKLSGINDAYSWYQALHYYLKAHQMRPHRAEPLVRIAEYYVKENQKAIAYIFAHRAATLPYPDYDILFIEKGAYDYLRYDLLGQCAVNVGEYEVGKNAVLKALEYNHTLPHLHNNLGVYLRQTKNIMK